MAIFKNFTGKSKIDVPFEMSYPNQTEDEKRLCNKINVSHQFDKNYYDFVYQSNLYTPTRSTTTFFDKFQAGFVDEEEQIK